MVTVLRKPPTKTYPSKPKLIPKVTTATKPHRILALDTETTGKDLFHGSVPYFVTMCYEGEDPFFWEWPVDPLTRHPEIPPEDLLDIIREIEQADEIVIHNAKFDVIALAQIIPDYTWPWYKTRCTLRASHLLASNQPHNLTALCIHYLGKNIEPYELRLKEACHSARRMVRSRFKDWAIAKEGRPDMPSIKGSGNSKKKLKGVEDESPWKADAWMLRALAQENDYAEPEEGCKHTWGKDFRCEECGGHSWWILLQQYSNVDSFFTGPLWKRLKKEIEGRGYWDIYMTCLQALPIASDMEFRGVTENKERMDELKNKFKPDSDRRGEVLVDIAAKYDYDLKLPKGASPNNSLRSFMLDVLKLEPQYPKRMKKAKTNNPTLDKDAMLYYLLTCEPGSDQLKFVDTLLGKRACDTSLSYIAAYERFWVPLGIYNKKGEQLWYCLHPNLNPTGTATLRWSCSNPNEQNISKKKEECRICSGRGTVIVENKKSPEKCLACEGTGFISYNVRYGFGPLPDEEWWSLDAENIELRIPAYKANEQVMIELFERPKDPPYFGSNHLLYFDILHPDMFAKYGREVKEVYASTWYQWTKNGNFAIQYNAGKRTADAAYHMDGAFELIKSRLSRLEALNQEQIAKAEKYGYVETVPDKTVDPKRGYPLLCTRSEYGDIVPTVPLSYYVQGTAMWWMQKAMIRCKAQMDEWKREGVVDSWIVMQVHDELVFRFPKGRGAEPWKTNLPYVRKLRSLMAEGGNDIDVPTPVSITYHANNWRDGKKIT